MFIVGGFNAYPAEIEGMMLEHPALSQVAVVGVPDERMGEVGVRVRRARGPAPSSTDAELIAWCRERMANYKVPRRVEFVDALPLNASGKVLKYRAARTGRRGLNSTVAPVLIFASPISGASRAGVAFGSITAS